MMGITLSRPVVEKLCTGLGYQLVREDDARLVAVSSEPTDAERLQDRLDQALAKIERYRRREREAITLVNRLTSLWSTADRRG